MVYFNDTDIEVYDLDSVESVIARLCVSENTIPRYIYFPDEILNIESLSTENVIQFVNCVNIFKNSKNFGEVYDKLKDKFSFNELVTNFILFNNFSDNVLNQIKKDPENENYILQAVFYNFTEELKKIEPETSVSIEDIWNSRYSKIKTYKEEVEKNKKKVNNTTRSFIDFQKIKGKDYTKFELEKVKFQIELDIENISLLELFNDIKLDKNAPFATTKYFYKILKNIKPFETWSNLFDRSKTYFDKYKNINRDENIVVKILQNNSDENLERDYTEAIINVKKDNPTVKMSHNIKKFNISDEDLIKRFLTIANLNTYKNRKNISVNGVFYFPNQKINKYIISDIIMNDPLFSGLLTIDETVIGSRGNVYIHFDNKRIENLTAYITMQRVIKNRIPVDNIYKDLFPNNSYYLRIKIRNCENIEKVEYFQNIFSKLIILYNEKEETVREFYEKYNLKLEDEIYEEDIIDEKLLKNIEPEIFRANYTKKCPNPPTYVTDEEAEKAQIEGKQVMIFPKEITNDIIPKKYICDYKVYKYPGLRDNPFDNADVFPFIPCCRKKDQVDKKGSKYREYYFNEKIKKKKKQGGLYISNIIIPNDAFGILPENINKIFAIADFHSKYYRKGVFRNVNSFLNCVLEALYEETDILSIKDENEREKKLTEIRNSLVTPDLISACKQEMYDYKNEDIIEILLNEKKYLDPTLFIHLLEIKYNCNIFLFRKEPNNLIVVPRHIKGYYKTKNNAKCIFIYEHTGGESEKIEYPQCELIVRQYEDDTEYNFPCNSNISKNIFDIFEKINTYYIFNKKITFTNFNLNYEDIKILSQFIDTYGKTRIINVRYRNNIISVITTPIQPINIKQDMHIVINKVESNIILDFLDRIGGKNLYQIIDEVNIVKEVHASVGNINIIIPASDKSYKIPKLPFSVISKEILYENFERKISVLSYPENNISILNSYNKYKKLSRYIFEYLLWLYSIYVYDNSIDEDNILNENNLKNFKEDHTEIIEDFNYPDIPKTFSLKSPILNNEKLIIKSEETLKRLFYSLLLSIKRNFKKFIEYKDRKTIENYYVDITDFDVYPFQVILEGENSIIKWLNDKNNENIILYDKIIMGSLPYFFHSNLIENGRIFLIQNTDSVLKAINISIIWKIKGYNGGNNIEIINNSIPQFTLYSYISNKNIIKYNIIGEKNNYNIKIIGYKINEESFYSVLLEL